MHASRTSSDSCCIPRLMHCMLRALRTISSSIWAEHQHGRWAKAEGLCPLEGLCRGSVQCSSTTVSLTCSQALRYVTRKPPSATHAAWACCWLSMLVYSM